MATQLELEIGNWRPALGYPHYKVCDDGRIMKMVRSGGQWGTAGELMVPNANFSGYHRITLRNEKQRRVTVFVHRVVYESFNGKIPPELQINHKNTDKTDNRLTNLEVVTQSENMWHAYAYLGKKGRGGCNRKKLTKNAVIEIQRLSGKGINYRRLAKRFGVSHHTIWRAVKGRTKGVKGDKAV